MSAKKVYRGWKGAKGTRHATVNGRPLRIVDYHSNEFSWSYGGSGPSTLALSILANYFGERPKRTSKRLFNGDYRCWQITSEEIAAWLETQPAYEPLDQHGRTVFRFQDLL